MVSYLIKECKADINARNYNFTTPLHISIGKNDKEMTKLLLSFNADVEAYPPEPEKYNYPIIYALECAKDSVCKHLFFHYLQNCIPRTKDIQKLRNWAEEYDRIELFNKYFTIFYFYYCNTHDRINSF